MSTSKKAIAGRLAEIVVGLAYLLAAGLKAQNLNLFIGQILAYHVFASPTALAAVAFSTLALETFLGASMLLGSPWRKQVLAAGLLMLLFFSGLIVYAWQVHGLKDCGCFGKVSMTPPQAISKNIVFILLTLLAWYGLVGPANPDGSPFYSRVRRLVPMLLALLLCAFALPQLGGNVPVSGPPPILPVPTPGAPGAPASTGVFSGYHIVPEYGDTIDLGKGEYLVALLSMTCEHCMATVPELNDYTYQTDLPQLVAICLEPQAGSMQDFQNKTGPLFPMHSVGNDMLTWAKICSDVPPQLCIVRDGVPVKVWKDTMPSHAELLEALKDAPAADSADSSQNPPAAQL